MNAVALAAGCTTDIGASPCAALHDAYAMGRPEPGECRILQVNFPPDDFFGYNAITPACG
jgi:hypothetical protein